MAVHPGQVPRVLIGGPSFIQQQLPTGEILTGPRRVSKTVPSAPPGAGMPYQPVVGGGTGPLEVITAAVAAWNLFQGNVGGGASPVTGQNGGNGRMTMTPFGGGYGIRGPGVPEPAPGTVAKQWSVAVHSNIYGTFRMYYFQMFDGWTLCYNPSTKQWKRYRTKHRSHVLPVGKTTLSQAVKAQKYLDRMWRTVAKKTKALKLA